MLQHTSPAVNNGVARFSAHTVAALSSVITLLLSLLPALLQIPWFTVVSTRRHTSVLAAERRCCCLIVLLHHEANGC